MRSLLALLLPVLLVTACAARGPLHPNAVALNKAGAYALAQGDLDTAQARLELAVEYHPNFVEAWINLGLLELSRGDLAMAEKRFRRALAIDRDAAGARVGLGAVAERRGDLPLAEKEYRAALAIDPGLAEPRANLARLLADRGALDEARVHLRRLIEVQADDPAGWMALCEVLWRMGRDPEAAQVVDEARARLGDRPEVELLLARRDLRAGELDEAIARLEPLAKEPAAIGRAAGGWLAVARLEKGDVPGARAAARAVLARDPEDRLARHVIEKTGT
ncbi:MAG: tetratricopeptide repeat protein [Deltaproteobacteria bacterium]|nr:tetratricopeptide repeat protein [Deltaproteobacteria bacterium]